MADIYVRVVGKKGKGVFAGRPFVKGERILYVQGEPVHNDIALKMSPYSRGHMGSSGLHHSVLWCSPERYVNHSCVPNVFERERWVVAMSDIGKDDELVFDYSMNGVTGVDDWRMRCRCGSPRCRGIVRGEFFGLPLELQFEYLPFLDAWFVEAFKEELDKLRA